MLPDHEQHDEDHRAEGDDVEAPRLWPCIALNAAIVDADALRSDLEDPGQGKNRYKTEDEQGNQGFPDPVGGADHAEDDVRDL